MATPPDEFFHKQEKALQRYSDARVAQLLRYLEQSRKELQGVLAEPDTYTASRVASLIKQIDEISADVRKDIRSIGVSVPDLAEMSKAHLEASASAITGRTIVVSFDALNLDVLRKFSASELDKVTTLTQAEIQTVKSVLFTKVGVQGQNPAKVAKMLAGKDSQFAKKYGVLENIFRTEVSNIYNAQSVEGIKAINNKYDLVLNKRIVETIDPKRNHPISLLLNGMVQKADGQFKVKVSAVQAKAKAIKRGRGGGVLWPIQDGYYVGDRLPAHYRERGVMVPTEQDINN